MSNTPTLTSSEESRAPWNDESNKELEFIVEAEFVLRKRSTVTTTDYRDEDGCINTDDVDWEKEYLYSHYTPKELFAILEKYVRDELNGLSNDDKEQIRKANRLKKILNECQLWQVYDEYFELADD